MEQDKIDFVVPWVDGNDLEWRRQKDVYAAREFSGDPSCRGNERERFRNWDQFRYWFRGVEKYAPWVNRIFLVTCGHLPEWLNTEHPRLQIVHHSEIIPKDFLPVFSSHPIDLCVSKIKNLSEQFVYFNDDIFLTAPMEKTAFFRNHLPCLKAELINLGTYPVDFFWRCILIKDLEVINRNFVSSEVMKNVWRKFIHPVYGLGLNLKMIYYLPWIKTAFPGFRPRHSANPYLKSVCGEVWEKEKQELMRTCSHRFRSYDDVNQYIFLWWHICTGQFFPVKEYKLYATISTSDNTDFICSQLENCKTPIICINDNPVEEKAFLEKKERINKTLDILFPQKSSFEK